MLKLFGRVFRDFGDAAGWSRGASAAHLADQADQRGEKIELLRRRSAPALTKRVHAERMSVTAAE